MSQDATTPPPPKAKKLPFKPTALRKSASHKVGIASDDADPKKDNDDDGLDLFRRGKYMEPIITADRERRMKKMLKQKQKQEEQQEPKSFESAKRPLDDQVANEADANTPSPKSPQLARASTPVAAVTPDEDLVASEMVTPPASKRTRLDSSSSRKSIFSTPTADGAIHSSPSTRLLRSQSRQEGNSSAFNRLTATPSSAPILLLDSDDDADDNDGVHMAPGPSRGRSESLEIVNVTSAAPVDDDEEEEEFADYVRQAEERRALDQAMLSVGPDGETVKDVIEILVTSLIPEAKACRFKFLYDKKLRFARNAWLDLQHHKGVLHGVVNPDEIVLTWRQRKVYASSTLLNLGIRPRGKGQATVDDNSTDGLADGRTRVHMEAWTLDLFSQMEREQEEQRRKREAGDLSDEDDAEHARQDSPAPVAKIQVILKARDFEELGLAVLPETTVETLITAFRSQRPVGYDREVGIWVDGERLEEHVTMDEAEIMDMDTLDIYIK